MIISPPSPVNTAALQESTKVGGETKDILPVHHVPLDLKVKESMARLHNVPRTHHG